MACGAFFLLFQFSNTYIATKYQDFSTIFKFLIIIEKINPSLVQQKNNLKNVLIEYCQNAKFWPYVLLSSVSRSLSNLRCVSYYVPTYNMYIGSMIGANRYPALGLILD